MRLYLGFLTPQEAKEKELIYSEFENNYASHDCMAVIENYDQIKLKKLPISTNLKIKVADCYTLMGDTSQVQKLSNELGTISNSWQKSIILNQNGLQAINEGDTVKGINLFKKAIETENTNNFAKRNFEFLKKVYHPNDRASPPDQRNDSDNSLANTGGIAGNSNEREDELEYSEPPEINRTQALQLLDALRANEYNKLPVLFGSESDTLDFGNW